MSNLTENKVKLIYSQYKEKAKCCCNQGDYNSAIKYIKAVALTGYSFYMGFKDDDIEEMLCYLSKFIKKNVDYVDRTVNECVFYDSFSVDNGGLVQQYLRALISCGYKIRYIAERSVILNESSAIGRMLREYNRAEIIVIPKKLKPLVVSQFIYDRIMEIPASRLFIHSSPYSATACCAFYALPLDIVKYKIDLTDHTFWIGTGFINYSFEFRPFGCVVSLAERGLKKNQLFYLPFYPIMQHGVFLGFPKASEGKIILFSGANYYKVFDVNDTFFLLVKAILDACPNMVLLFAGTGDREMLNEKIEKYHLEGRFIPIGQRSDITECFEHCDIYLNTYPIGGGLMTQYAAQLGKPILNYQTSTTTKAEEFVCQVKQMTISNNNIDDLVNRVKKLSEDAVYRQSYGENIRSCVVTSDLFNRLFYQCMKDGINPLDYSEDISFEEHHMDIQDKLLYENKNMSFDRNFTKIIGFPSIWQCPSIFIRALISIFKSNRFIEVLKNHLTVK